MASFEDFGRQIDEDIERLRKYINEEFRPGAERKSVEWLRKAADKLSEVAAEIERRITKVAGAPAGSATGTSDARQGPA